MVRLLVAAAAGVWVVAAGLWLSGRWPQLVAKMRARYPTEQAQVRMIRNLPWHLGAAGASAVVFVSVALWLRWWLAIPPAIAAAGAVYAWRGSLREQNRQALTEAWPPGVEVIRSHIDAGASLPEAVSALAATGPPHMREVFAGFDRDNGLDGFVVTVGRIAERARSATADTVCDALAAGYRLGTRHVSRVLEPLAGNLTRAARVANQLRANQAQLRPARVIALTAPWAVLTVLIFGTSVYYDFYLNTRWGPLVVVSIVVWQAILWPWINWTMRTRPEPRVADVASPGQQL